MILRTKPLIAFLLPIAVLYGCGGGSEENVDFLQTSPAATPTTPAIPPALASKFDEADKASRFLTLGTFGASQSDIDAVMDMDAAEWIASEYEKPGFDFVAQSTNTVSPAEDEESRTVSSLFWDTAITADDQLRQRMIFALSQILVMSSFNSYDYDLREMHGYHKQILSNHAFGNYRDLLESITYSQGMAMYLTYFQNQKGDMESGRTPDENYAREFMQLFTIGLVELNMDGTIKLDETGEEIPTYANTDVTNLARVFTGLSTDNGDWDDSSNYDEVPLSAPLGMFDEYHSELEKTFLGTTIPAGTLGDESITRALDTVFAHSNLAPFVSRQLIQRFTDSNPDLEYVERVATVFETGTFTATNGRVFGTGERGDLGATLAAILLDSTVIDVESRLASTTSGKVREPFLRFTQWARAFNLSDVLSSNETLVLYASDFTTGIGQNPFEPASVFNFYQPGFIPSKTLTGDLGMTVPEFQIVNENTTTGFINAMTDFVQNTSAQVDDTVESYTPDYTTELTLAYDDEGLMDHLDALLTSGQLPDDDRAEILDILSTMSARTDTVENEAEDRLLRVQVAIVAIIRSPVYTVIR